MGKHKKTAIAEDNPGERIYMGNANLPAPGSSYDYSNNPEWVAEIKKCKKSLLHFAENHFFIINIDDGRQKIELRKYQKRLLKTLKNNRFVVCLASRQIGKALALDTPVPVPTGWTTMGELKEGDLVYDIHGNECKVIKAHDILYDRECFKVVFDNGEEIIADGEHQWFTENRSERRIGGSVKTTKEIFKTLYYGNKRQEPNHRIPRCLDGIKGKKHDLPIHPYILGLWLGDGTSKHGTITVGHRDFQETINNLKQIDQFDKFLIKQYNTKNYFVTPTSNKDRPNHSLKALLRQNNLIDNKHIPFIYTIASREQRLELLKGLIDSDGYVNRAGTCQFYNTNKLLVKQVKELVESLGYKVTMNEYIPKLNGVECTPAACITFKPIEGVCKLSFKLSRIKFQEKNCNSKIRGQYHYIKDIIPIMSVPVRCITVDSKDSLFLVGKQYIPTHNSTVLTIYMLWVALFNEDQSILLAANKEESAKEVFKRVKLAYEMLPNYLKSPVVKYAETSMVFDNGSSISVTTTTSDTGRGRSVSLLCLDELAHIEPGLLDTFWASVYPVISSSKKAKIFAVSTPNGVGNLFHSLYTNSLKKGDDWNGWASERVDWWEVPDRDEAWKQKTIKTMGSVEKFAQEFENVFISSGESAIDEGLYEHIKAGTTDPKYVYDDGAYLIWDPPADDKLYIVGVDIGEGLGLNASVAQILDITDLTNIKQVGQYYTKSLNPYNFTQKLHEILNHWGRPTVAIERNSCGGQVVDNLRNNFNYENIVSWGAKPIDNKPFERIGILSHVNTKYRGIMNMRYWLNEMRVVHLNDIKTLQELSEFVRKPNNTWSGRTPNTLDDRVMALVWALVVLENELCTKYFDVVKFNDSMRPEIIKSLDYGFKGKVINPVGFYNNEMESGFNNPLPTLFTDNGANYMGPYFENEDLSELHELGWRFIDKQ